MGRYTFDRQKAAQEARVPMQPMSSSGPAQERARPLPTALSDSSRPRLSRPFYDNPIVQSTAAFAAAVIMGSLATITVSTEVARVAITGLALVAGVAGLLVLVRSAAVRRIAQLRDARNELRGDVVQARAYLQRLPQVLDTVTSLHRGHGSSETGLAAILDGSIAIISGTRSEICGLALIRTAQDAYHVENLTGNEFLGITAGKTWPADRALTDVLDSMACPYFLVHFRMSTSHYGLAFLSETASSEFDRQFVEGLAAAIALMPPDSSQMAHQPSTSHRRLRSI